MITGPQGAGKTTLAGQLVLALCGLSDEVLGLPVKRADGPVVYLAMDRPRQIARSFARMVSDGDRKRLRKALKVWQGPPPVSVVQEPASLCQWARDEHNARYVIIDSYKNLAADLGDGTTGAAINAAVQECVAEASDGWGCIITGRRWQIIPRRPLCPPCTGLDGSPPGWARCSGCGVKRVMT